MTHKVAAIAIAAALFCSCNSPEKTTSASTADSTTTISDTTGWTALFDGTSTAGWHSYGKTAPGGRWKVSEGALFLDTAKAAGEGGDLVTQGEYENFHLKYDWKISKNGNSGVIFLAQEDTSKYKYVWNTGLEMQVLDNDGHPDGKITKHRAGDLYDLIKVSTENVKPVGEWNTAEIIMNNGKLDLRMNDSTVVSTTLWDDAWKQLVAGSKFASMPGFATFKKGHIALQDHGDMVWFRNILIKEL